MSKKVILLVDDSETMLMMEQMLFNGKPWSLETAKDGLEAIEKANSTHPDLILMDVEMPRMDGITACQEIRKNEKTKGIPIIFISTKDEERFVESGFLSGCCDYILKPFDPTELMVTVEHYLND